VRYLRSGQSGFASASWTSPWTSVPLGLRMHQTSWTWGDSEGELLAFAGQTGCAFQIDAGRNMRRGPSHPRGERIGRLESRAAGQEETEWVTDLDFQVEAMVLTADSLFLAGPADRDVPEGPGVLYALRRAGGDELQPWDLPVGPVLDGLAAAEDLLVAVLKNGRVLCLRLHLRQSNGEVKQRLK